MMKAPQPEVVATASRQNPGETLRQAREQKGLSLSQVAGQLNLTENSLRQLENGAFDKLPGHTFSRGYIRAYAKLMGLDQAELVNSFDHFTGIFQAADLRDGGSDVAGLGVGHALHGDRRIAAHRDVADPDFPRLAANDRRSAMNAHCPTFRRAVSPRTKGVTSTGWPL